MLPECYEADRQGRRTGQLQELMGFHFAAASLAPSIAHFDYKVTMYEEKSGEKIGDKLRMTITQRGCSDAQLQTDLVLQASRLSAWELERHEVQGVLTAMQAIVS